MKKNNIEIISLFSGIGAYEKALTNIGVVTSVLKYCENNKYSSAVYSAIHNIPE